MRIITNKFDFRTNYHISWKWTLHISFLTNIVPPCSYLPQKQWKNCGCKINTEQLDLSLYTSTRAPEKGTRKSQCNKTRKCILNFLFVLTAYKEWWHFSGFQIYTRIIFRCSYNWTTQIQFEIGQIKKHDIMSFVTQTTAFIRWKREERARWGRKKRKMRKNTAKTTTAAVAMIQHKPPLRTEISVFERMIKALKQQRIYDSRWI